MEKELFALIKEKWDDHKKLILILLAIGVFIYLILFYPTAQLSFAYKIIKNLTEPDLYCNQIQKEQKLFQYGVNSSSKRYIDPYIKISNTLDKNQVFEKFRLLQLENSLKKGDSVLIKEKELPYGIELILPLIKKNDNTSNKILSKIIGKKIIYINESINKNENQECKYDLALCMAKDSYNNIKAIKTLIENDNCIEKTIEEEVINPLRNHWKVEISLNLIFDKLCDSCQGVKIIKQLIKDCGNNYYACEGLYFEKGKYELSAVSETIFECIYKRLIKEPNSSDITVEFHGYTDSDTIKGVISYSGNAQMSSLGGLLDEDSTEGHTIVSIKDNNELSFVRAFSCLKFMKKLFLRNNLHLQYTGHGKLTTNLSDNKLNRTVKIIIKRN